MDYSYGEILEEDLKKYVCFLEFKDKVIPFTKSRAYLGGSTKKPYNLYTHAPDTFNVDEVINYTIFGDIQGTNLGDHISQTKKIVERMKRCVEMGNEKNFDKNDKLISDLYHNGSFLKDNDDYNFFYMFDYSITIGDIKKDSLSNKDEIIKAYKKIIRKKIEENISELNELKQDCDEDDLEDIDSIIEMFTDIEDEMDTDLENVTKLSDLVEIFPPLLNPCEEMIQLIKYLEKYPPAPESFLDSIKDPELLKEFLNELENIDDEEMSDNFIIGKQLLEERLKELSNG